MGAGQFQRDREPSTGAFGSDPNPEGQESETLRARIASELRDVERLQRIARPVALIVFALLGLLVVLQLFTWTRLEQLATLGQQREERATAAQAAMQEAIEKQREALDQAVQQMASRGHSYPKSDLLARDIADRGTANAAQAPQKLIKTSKEAQPEHRTATGPATGRPVPEKPVAARQVPSQDVSAMPQKATVVYQNPSANPRDLSANRQETSPPPTSQGLEAVQNEQHEGTEISGMRPGQADTVIARDHNEIERLRKLGKRDYVEFTLVRSGSRQEVAPDISLQLRRVDSKRLRCALSIYAEDYEFPTDLAINEPVVFPIRAMWESVELVINKVGKDTVGGYLTARKGVLVAR
jgi:hypothetical protein